MAPSINKTDKGLYIVRTRGGGLLDDTNIVGTKINCAHIDPQFIQKIIYSATMDNQQCLCQRYLEPNSTYRSVILLVPLKDITWMGRRVPPYRTTLPPVLSYLYGKLIIEQIEMF